MHHPSLVIKYCPFCGASDPVYDGVKALRCTICGRRQFINAVAAVAVIIRNERGEILLTRRAHDPGKGMLDMPGGFVDALETVEQTVRREVKEELNLDLETISYLTSFPNEYLFEDMITYTADLAFAATVKDWSVLQPADDVAAVEFYAPENIPMDEVVFKSIRQFVTFIKFKVDILM
ncbi:MAG: NUDIX domain-containing protein [Bacteroidales bacterium]|nr:NUDIX domain-containing protein [Bacteroidales bacterium]MCL2132903.1 NUDIX domain-containing protein [Bacteroidales bacterium]